MTIDFDRPVRARDLHMDATNPAEILRANLPEPYVAVGLVYLPRMDGKKGVEPVVKLFNSTGIAECGTRIENFEPEPAAYTPRSLRVSDPTMRFQTRAGVEAVFIGANGVDLDFEIMHPKHETASYVTTDDKGRVVEPRPQNASELDIVEVTPGITRYVRIYDKPKTAKNPSNCTNWYEFDSLAEAQANLQGVRAIAVVEYKEGQNLA